ncbi:hypothetical protein [Fulvivirga lutea]|uniref:Seryl-tRNA synthetase n=1 Tax=Fulvivirga lutea TaxID=2810512 RepID=A0A974WG04_9BACT|nr:hypothetical protein [Fulvivirga lutea]QSE96442.1 hypothetical protein JR347_12620 [Fulvivirga lutea]
MKRIIIKSMVVLLVVCGTNTFANTTDKTNEKVTEEVSEKTSVLIHRIEEIKSMDKSTMTRAEKKTVKNELKAIKRELKQQDNGVYISVGGVIIIVLLLILLL